MNQRDVDKIIADMDENEIQRDKLDNDYHHKSEELMTQHERLIEELRNWKP